MSEQRRLVLLTSPIKRGGKILKVLTLRSLDLKLILFTNAQRVGCVEKASLRSIKDSCSRRCSSLSGRGDTALVETSTQFLPMHRNGFSWRITLRRPLISEFVLFGLAIWLSFVAATSEDPPRLTIIEPDQIIKAFDSLEAYVTSIDHSSEKTFNIHSRPPILL